MSDSSPLSRRQFLAGCAGCATALATPAVADTPRGGDYLLGDGGQISPEGQASIAAVDERFQQERPKIQKTVSAVDDIGLDPSGGIAINGKFESALSGLSNTRIKFPKDGTFSLSRKLSAEPDGPIELMGNGCSFTIPQGTEMKSFVLTLPSGSVVSDIVLDQTAEGALQEFTIRTNGIARVKNVTVKGYAPAKSASSDSGGVDSMFSPIALSEDAVVQARNFKAVSGTAAGTHRDDDLPESATENSLASPMGIWAGRSTQGTIQLIQPTVRGWSNGIYGGRTKGKVEIRGGLFANNFNAQIRVGGGSVVDGTSILLDDREWSKKAHPGPFRIGHQGVLAGRVDAKHGDLTDPVTFKNLRVVANSMRHVSALFRWNHEAGPGHIKNCHFTNHIDAPIVYGRSPSTPAATNILIENCLIKGSSTGGVMEVTNRPQSRISNTCIQLPKAGPDDIQGAQIGDGVSFGPQCKSGNGLSSPKEVGTVGNISSLPAPSYNGSGVSMGVRSGPSRQEVRKKNRNWAMKAISTFVAAGVAFAIFLCMALIAAIKFLKD